LINIQSDREVIIGVVGDTHIPDRVSSLHPALIPNLRKRGVQYIFHTGDISFPVVLKDLAKVAPVYAVAGNRDWFQRSLPRHLVFCVNGVDILLTHGHVNPFLYWLDKAKNILEGYHFDRYARRLPPLAPDVKMYIFGHSHHAENRWLEGRLFFNPGSCSIAEKPDFRISFGIIHIRQDGNITGEIVALEGARIRLGRWVEGE
jgi:putative phosphoesterase